MASGSTGSGRRSALSVWRLGKTTSSGRIIEFGIGGAPTSF